MTLENIQLSCHMTLVTKTGGEGRTPDHKVNSHLLVLEFCSSACKMRGRVSGAQQTVSSSPWKNVSYSKEEIDCF